MDIFGRMPTTGPYGNKEDANVGTYPHPQSSYEDYFKLKTLEIELVQKEAFLELRLSN